MSEPRIEALIETGAIRRVKPDQEAARRELATARRHIQTAARDAAEDETAALAVAYEAARKALSAHMRANGFRVGRGDGGHARMGEYGLAVFDDPAVAEHLREFDQIRRLRNRSQYDALLVEQDDVEFALVHARAIVAAAEADLA